MSDKSQMGPYGSARDLPTVKELEQQMAGLRLFAFLLGKDKRNQLREFEGEHRRITNIVDVFYELLGGRNWVFTEDLNLSEVEHVIDTEDAVTAETRLIEYYKREGRISFSLHRLTRFEAMRPRMEMLKKALADYEAGRYYSTVFVLLSVMDGFVNDIDRAARRGLHAQAEEDMVAWDSVVGHHLGLAHAHRSFTKSYKKTEIAEVNELFRNGIMHGTLVNFDNQIVATKAWNRLFAVVDWADSRERHAKPVEPTPTFRESFLGWKDAQQRKARVEDWKPYEYVPDFSSEDLPEVARVCVDFLEKWQRGQWGLVGSYFLEISARSSIGKLAPMARDLYRAFELSEWKISCVRHVAAAVALADVELVVNETTYRTNLRWIRVGDTGKSAMEWESGRWALVLYGPSNFLKPENIIDV
ncbi:hypothetical protein [Nocardiopsis sp. NPDC006938]|uniref:hypothetical protein n=1 Tax=Nocardiopsis sp. NPDC006938 TaxID=3364337 RepID=UPI0036AE869A